MSQLDLKLSSTTSKLEQLLNKMKSEDVSARIGSQVQKLDEIQNKFKSTKNADKAEVKSKLAEVKSELDSFIAETKSIKELVKLKVEKPDVVSELSRPSPIDALITKRESIEPVRLEISSDLTNLYDILNKIRKEKQVLLSNIDKIKFEVPKKKTALESDESIIAEDLHDLIDEKRVYTKLRNAVKNPSPVMTEVEKPPVRRKPLQPPPSSLPVKQGKVTSTKQKSELAVPNAFYNVRLSNKPVFLRRTTIKPDSLKHIQPVNKNITFKEPRVEMKVQIPYKRQESTSTAQAIQTQEETKPKATSFTQTVNEIAVQTAIETEVEEPVVSAPIQTIHTVERVYVADEKPATPEPPTEPQQSNQMLEWMRHEILMRMLHKKNRLKRLKVSPELVESFYCDILQEFLQKELKLIALNVKSEYLDALSRAKATIVDDIVYETVKEETEHILTRQLTATKIAHEQVKLLITEAINGLAREALDERPEPEPIIFNAHILPSVHETSTYESTVSVSSDVKQVEVHEIAIQTEVAKPQTPPAPMLPLPQDSSVDTTVLSDGEIISYLYSNGQVIERVDYELIQNTIMGGDLPLKEASILEKGELEQEADEQATQYQDDFDPPDNSPGLSDSLSRGEARHKRYPSTDTNPTSIPDFPSDELDSMRDEELDEIKFV